MPNPCLTRGRHIKCSAKFARQKEDVPSILLDVWQRAHNTDSCSTENRVPPKVASLQLDQNRAYFTERKLHRHPKRRIPTRGASLKQHNPCVYSTCIQSLLLQFSSTVHWHKQMTVYSWFKVHQQHTQSTGRSRLCI